MIDDIFFALSETLIVTFNYCVFSIENAKNVARESINTPLPTGKYPESKYLYYLSRDAAGSGFHSLFKSHD